MNVDALLQVMSRKQIASIVDSSARINIWHGAVRSGKTIASLLRFLVAVVAAPRNGLIFIVGRTIQTIERNILDPLMQPDGPFGPLSRYVLHTRGANTAVIFGRVVHLVGANDVRAESKIRGSTASLIYVDEATLIPETFFTMCLSRLSVDGAQLLATTNPDSPMHWLRQKFLLREAQLNMRSWHFNLDDNPSLSTAYRQALAQEYTGLFHRRFVKGEWCLAEGAVYDMWDEARHVVTDAQLPPITNWVGLGIDYGTVNPFAAELLGLGADGRLYLVDEFYYASKTALAQLTDVEYSARLRAWLDQVPVPHSGAQPLRGVAPRWVAIDPSAASFRRQLHNDGITSVLADNSVMDGIRLTASLLSTGRLKVHQRCTAFRAEVSAYSWDEKAAKAGQDAPVKVDDHALDAERYAVVTTQGVWRNKLCPPNTDVPQLPAAA